MAGVIRQIKFMPRRKQLKSIASGIAGGFSSRNNDVDGYWGMGILYKEANASGSSKFELNLLTGESIPRFRYSKRVALPYYEFLLKQMKNLGFEEHQVTNAEIEIEFNVSPTKKQIIFKSTWGEPFVCKVSLTDDNNRVWSSEFRDWCGQHNPNKESRSIRRYAL